MLQAEAIETRSNIEEGTLRCFNNNSKIITNKVLKLPQDQWEETEDLDSIAMVNNSSQLNTEASESDRAPNAHLSTLTSMSY